jgi:hypothetical protein
MEEKSEAKALDSIVPKICLRLVPMRMGHKSIFCVKQEK